MVMSRSTMRMASTAAPSAPSLSPRPIHREAAMAAASVVRISSRAMLRSGLGSAFSAMIENVADRCGWGVTTRRMSEIGFGGERMLVCAQHFETVANDPPVALAMT